MPEETALGDVLPVGFDDFVFVLTDDEEKNENELNAGENVEIGRITPSIIRLRWTLEQRVGGGDRCCRTHGEVQGGGFCLKSSDIATADEGG